MATPTMPGPQHWGSGTAPQAQVPTQPTAPPSATDRRERGKAIARIVGSAVIALLAVLTVGLLAPDTSTSDAAAERLVIWIDDDANQERTEGAPQQAVVNGWTGNALLDLISQQLDDAAVPVDHRPAVLLALAVLLLALVAVTTPARPTLDSTGIRP